MRILVATGAPTLPQMIGGSQRSGDTLLRGLAARGHEVAITAGLDGEGFLGWRGRILMKLTGRRAVVDTLLGYPAYRSWYPAQSAGEVARRFKPDVVVVLAHSTGSVAHAFAEAGVPVLFNFQDVEFDAHGYDLAQLAPIRGVANSAFTAAAYRSRFGATCTVIHPIINPEQYRTEVTGRYVTFVNPSPLKGLAIAIEVARLLPDIEFRFQETWPLSSRERSSLTAAIGAIPNIVLAPREEDMRKVYAQTRILLAPSQWAEGYGRIATEAQISGIPVIGSHRGGLPEAIGDGGSILPADASPQTWAAEVRSLWHDDTRYKALSEAAQRYAARRALNRDHQLDEWERALREAAGLMPQRALDRVKELNAPAAA